MIPHTVFQTVILATHNITVLPMVDCVVVLDEGRIVDVGTYEHVATNSATFASLLKAQSEGTSKVQPGMLLVLYLYPLNRQAETGEPHNNLFYISFFFRIPVFSYGFATYASNLLPHVIICSLSDRNPSVTTVAHSLSNILFVSSSSSLFVPHVRFNGMRSNLSSFYLHCLCSKYFPNRLLTTLLLPFFDKFTCPLFPTNSILSDGQSQSEYSVSSTTGNESSGTDTTHGLIGKIRYSYSTLTVT